MDCQTLSRAYQQIARETTLEQLLLQALTLIRNYTEAEFGCILIESTEQWLVKAISTVDEASWRGNFTTNNLPRSIINHVDRVREVVCLNHPIDEIKFVDAPYLNKGKPKSILCVPLIARGSLEAIVYLENNSKKQVFTSEHLTNLELLAEPIAISISNTKIYENLNRNQQQLHQFLEVLPVGVEVLDAAAGLYYTNRRAKELRAKGIIAEASPKPLLEPELICSAANNSLPTDIFAPEKSTPIAESENNITLVESWSNSIIDERGEVLYIINAFQDITEQKKAEQLLEEYNRTLEIQVRERTLELSQALENLKTAQNKLIQSEKMVALGHLVAGVAHEINTPLGVIRASSYNNIKALAEFLEQMPQLFNRLPPPRQELFFTFLEKSLQNESPSSSREKRKLKRNLQAQLEKTDIAKARQIADILADIGIYHDIDPFIPLLQDSNADLILQLAYNLSRLQGNSNNAIIAVERASKVVFALKNYARYDPTGEKQQVDITEGIEIVLDLYHNQLKHGIEVIRDYASLPLIFCYPDELIQVWTNLVHNAIQAMNGKGKLEISVKQENDRVIVRITDSGSGIPPELKEKIFEPFFTTKPMGEGSGLGLDISRKIIDKHHGQIEVDSVPGRTTFKVSLSVNL
ncbi:MAG: ATP-binding protein [Xenococcaceae cyanobacterium]